MKNLIRTNLVLGSAVLSLVACGSANSSKSIGPQGGTLTSDLGVTLTVPAGALTSSTQFSLREASSAPAGSTVAVEIEPRGVHFEHPAVVTFSGFDDNGGRRKAMRSGDDNGWHALRGSREVESRRENEALVDDTGTVGLVESSESCDDGSDDDGDGLADCADSACLHSAACGSAACVTDDSCPCGSDCVNGSCTAVGAQCSSDADCATGMTCGEGRRHGQACNFAVCGVSDDAVKGHGGVGGNDGANHP